MMSIIVISKKEGILNGDILVEEQLFLLPYN